VGGEPKSADVFCGLSSNAINRIFLSAFMSDAVQAPATILLLASDPLMRTILHETLERSGYLVVSVADVGVAVDRIKQMRPDLLVIRPYINGMSGHKAADYLRSRCAGLPVLIVGGFMDDERVRVQNAIEDFYVFPTPFAPSDLLGNVRNVLDAIHEKGR
jgi:DNA-binding response OmpR family regulator